MDKQKTQEAIEIMQHWVDGGAVEFRARKESELAVGNWMPMALCDTFNFFHWEYRIKKEPLEIYYLVDDKGRYFNQYAFNRLADAENQAEYMGLNIIKMREVVDES